LEYSHHILPLLVGIAVAGVAALGAIAVGPYGRRGVRLTLAIVSFAALLGSALWLVTYLGWIEQRRAIEARLSELRAQALSTNSALACLEGAGDAIEKACEQTIFATAESLAAANVYTTARFDLLMSAKRYSGPRTAQFDQVINALQRSLQQDPFGLTANTLVLRTGCTAERCDAIAMFAEQARVRETIRQKTYQATVARHSANWRTSAPAAAAPAVSSPPSTGGETRAPIPDKYTLPSASSIPPVSIMQDEPERRPSAPAAAPERPSVPVQTGATVQPGTDAPPPEQPRPSASSPTALSPATPPPVRQKQPAARRETNRPNAPLSINPAAK
jgi:hypothetical protein